jgi:hypothetical protein
MDADARQMRDTVHRLVDEYRDRCLWFLRADYYPETREEILRTLESIEHHGDRQGFRRAAEIRQWLSRRTSDSSPARPE